MNNSCIFCNRQQSGADTEVLVRKYSREYESERQRYNDNERLAKPERARIEIAGGDEIHTLIHVHTGHHDNYGRHGYRYSREAYKAS